MTYGYGDSAGGWPEPDPAPRGRRHEQDEEQDGGWSTGRRPERAEPGWQAPADRGYGGAPGYSEPPAPRGYPEQAPPRGYRDDPGPVSGGRGTPPPRRPEPSWGPEPSREPSWGPEPSREPSWGAPGRGEGGGRVYGAPPGGRAPQAWQTDLAEDRAQRGYADPRERRGSVYGAGAPAAPTRPVGPPRPRTGEVYPGEDWAEPSAPQRQRGPLVKVLAVLAAVALVAVCGVGVYVTFLSGNGSDAKSGPNAHDISSQTVDPAPLTVAEVFPAATVSVTGNGSAPAGKPSAGASGAAAAGQSYQVVKPEATECKNAVVGDLAQLLVTAGCTQVVRATLLSADQQYVITTGLFNVRDSDAAKQAGDGVKGVVDATKGRFTGLTAGGATDIIGRAKTQLAWDTRGHFLLYCVIARADGKDPDAANPSVTQIVTDLVETYLNETVLTNRTLTPPPVPSGAGGSSAAK
jgi:hypothetical protein